MNGQISSGKGEPVLRHGVTKNSSHNNFWYEAMKIVDSMKFVKVRPNDQDRPAVLSNLSFTMSSLVNIASRGSRF